MTNRIKAILTALLIIAAVSAMCATAAAEYDPIVDNGMKAYVWCSDEGNGWTIQANYVANKLSGHGFEVIQHINPTPSLIYQTITDNDIKIYWGLGHGSDTRANTGNGYYYASVFGSAIAERDDPLTIGVFQHCGSYLCYTPGCWLQEGTQGNDNVVAQRFFGDGWCGEPSGDSGDCEGYLALLGSGISTCGYGMGGTFYNLDLGDTYEDAVENTGWTYAEGRKQGNRDLRYPQFCGDVNYDKVVNAADVTLLQMHLISPSTYPVHSDWDADVNGDGSVDSCDAMLIELHVSSPEEFPLYPRGWFTSSAPVIDVANLRRDVVTIRGVGFGEESDWSSVTISHEGIPLEHDVVSWSDARVVCWCTTMEVGDLVTVSTLHGTDSIEITGLLR